MATNGRSQQTPISLESPPIPDRLLSQFLRQILRLQMRVPPQHTQVFVTGDGRYFHDVEAALEQACGGLMAQVVKAQILDTGAVHGANVGAFDRFGSEAGEYLAVKATRQRAGRSRRWLTAARCAPRRFWCRAGERCGA